MNKTSSNHSAKQVYQISQEQLKQDLRRWFCVAPFSDAALDVFEMTRRVGYSAEQIAATIQRAPWLSAEILARSNSSFYNPCGEKITDLSQAVARIGQKRVGELALTSNSLFRQTQQSLQWMNPDLAWQRCIAAGVALECLVDQGDHYDISDGLTLAATLHLSGRAALAHTYSTEYSWMVNECRGSQRPLVALERDVFPLSHYQVQAELLQQWNIPEEVFLPLHRVSDDFDQIKNLPDPLRTRVELLKTAIAIGNAACHQWQDWDLIEFPQISIIDRIGVRNLSQVVDITGRDTKAIVKFTKRRQVQLSNQRGRFNRSRNPRIVRYINLSGYSYDVVGHILNSECRLQSEFDLETPHIDSPSIINCLGATASTRERLRRSIDQSDCVIICDHRESETLKNCGQVVGLPCSYGRLRTICLARSTQEIESTDEVSEESIKNAPLVEPSFAVNAEATGPA